MERPHWSYSSLSQYLRCPLQYFFQRIVGLPQKAVSSQLVLGGAVHEALAEYHTGIQQNNPRSSDQIFKAFLNAWKSREEQETIMFKAGETRSDSQEQGFGLIDAYLREPPPRHVVAVEQTTLTPICNSHGEVLEKPLVAIADLVTRQDDQLVIDEFKTSGKAYSEFEANTALQATCYANMARETYGEDALFRYTILIKTKTPKVQRLAAVRTEADVGRLGDLIQSVERAIAGDNFYPVESPQNCHSCPYRRQCRDWGTNAGHGHRGLAVVTPGVETQTC